MQMWITSKTTAVSTWALNGFYGEGTFTYKDKPAQNPEADSASLVFKDNKPLIHVADSCNALTLVVLFMGFILAYPGDWRIKLIFIPVGSIIIFGINVIRVLVLIYNYMYWQAAFDFNHKYTFTIAVYLVVFWFWMLWANKYSKKRLTASVNTVVST